LARLRQQFLLDAVGDEVGDVAGDTVDRVPRHLRVLDGGDVRGVAGAGRVAELGVAALPAGGDLLEDHLDAVLRGVERVDDLLTTSQCRPERDLYRASGTAALRSGTGRQWCREARHEECATTQAHSAHPDRLIGLPSRNVQTLSR
jgi:hypothetical protein